MLIFRYFLKQEARNFSKINIFSTRACADETKFSPHVKVSREATSRQKSLQFFKRTFILYLKILVHFNHLRTGLIVLMLTSNPENIIISTQTNAVRIVATEWLLNEALIRRATDVPAVLVRNMFNVKNRKCNMLLCKPKNKIRLFLENNKCCFAGQYIPIDSRCYKKTSSSRLLPGWGWGFSNEQVCRGLQ